MKVPSAWCGASLDLMEDAIHWCLLAQKSNAFQQREKHPPTEDTSIFDLPGILWRHNSTDPPAYIYLIEQATDGRGAWPIVQRKNKGRFLAQFLLLP